MSQQESDGIFRIRLATSDGEHRTTALLDSRHHRLLCGELLEPASGDDEGGPERPPIVGAVWCVSAWTRFVSASGVEVTVVHEAAALPGYPAGTEVVGAGDLIDAVAVPAPPPPNQLWARFRAICFVLCKI